MLLERNFASDHINIKDLTIEAPEKREELPFDPERDITQEDWERMKNQLKREIEKPPYYLDNVMNLFPERESELRVDAHYTELRRKFRNAWGRKSIRDILRYGKQFTLLFPKKIVELRLGDPYWEEIKEIIIERLQGDMNLGDLVAIKVLFPAYGFPSWFEKNVLAYIDASVTDCLRNMHSRRWQWIAELLAQKKILFPENEEGVDVKTWRGMKESFVRYRSEASTMARLGLDMKILAAKEVKITEKGLEIVMRRPHDDFQAPSLPLPELRKF